MIRKFHPETTNGVPEIDPHELKDCFQESFVIPGGRSKCPSHGHLKLSHS